MQEENKEGGLGASIGSIIIVIIVIVGGIYFWKNFSDKLTPTGSPTETMSTSTEVVDISADLDKIDLGSLDVE